jgi:hypothetical protein
MSGWSYTDPAMSCDASGYNCTGILSAFRVPTCFRCAIFRCKNNGNWGDKDIWKLGYDPERWGMVPDPKVLATVIRDGNYDFLTNSQRWHNTPGGFLIPNSMYLTAKPAFFGHYPWPWVNPTTGATYTLPAKARYDAGTPFAVAPTGTHDFNGDGMSDILWKDTSGNTAAGLMNGGTIRQAGDYGALPGWSVSGSATSTGRQPRPALARYKRQHCDLVAQRLVDPPDRRSRADHILVGLHRLQPAFEHESAPIEQKAGAQHVPAVPRKTRSSQAA